MNPKNRVVKITRRLWPVAKPCECPTCKGIRVQIDALRKTFSTIRS